MSITKSSVDDFRRIFTVAMEAYRADFRNAGFVPPTLGRIAYSDVGLSGRMSTVATGDTNKRKRPSTDSDEQICFEQQINHLNVKHCRSPPFVKSDYGRQFTYNAHRYELISITCVNERTH